MPGQDTAAYDAILKTVFEGGIRELIPTKARVLTRFEEKDATPWGGREVSYPAVVGRNEGSGWYSEMGGVPAAGRETSVTVRIPMRYQAGRISLSAQVMKHSASSRAAFEPAMEREMKGIVKSMAAERGRAIFGDGRGILCLVNEATPSGNTTVVVDAPGGFAGADNGGRFIHPGMVIAFVNPATGQIRAGIRTVTSVATAGTSFVVDSAPNAAVADNDYVVRALHATVTDVSDTAYQKEIMGLAGLVDDGTYVATLHGLNRTTWPIVQSHVITNGGAWSTDVFQRAADVADQRGGGVIDLWIMHHSARRAYLEAMRPDRRYSGADLMRPDEGTSAMQQKKQTLGGIEIMEDKYCPYNTVFCCDTGTFKRFVSVKGEWADEGGSILTVVGTGSARVDAFEGLFRIWDNFHVEEPATCARVDGLSTSLAIVHVD